MRVSHIACNKEPYLEADDQRSTGNVTGLGRVGDKVHQINKERELLRLEVNFRVLLSCGRGYQRPKGHLGPLAKFLEKDMEQLKGEQKNN